MNLKRLETLAAEHEQAAAALRTTLKLLGHTNGGSTNGSGLIDRAELQIATNKRGRKRKATKRKKPASPPAEPAFVSQAHARREKSAQFLSQFDSEKPFRPTGLKIGSPLGPLVNHGYLKAKGDGYVRTSKAYAV